MKYPDKNIEMSARLKELMECLSGELVEARSLLEYSKSQKASLQSMVDNEYSEENVEHFNELTQGSDRTIGKLLDFEERRTQLLLELAPKIGIPIEELTISILAENSFRGKHPSYSHELRKLKTELRDVFQEIMKVSQINRYLISRSLSFVEDRIRVFASTSDTYERGKKGDIRLPGLIDESR